MDQYSQIEAFIARWAETGGSEIANTQSFINDLCKLIGVDPPDGSHQDDRRNDYVFERRVFRDDEDGRQRFGRIDCYKRHSFILEAKQGSDADRFAADRGEDDLDLFGQTASLRVKRGTARRGTPGWAKAMLAAKIQAEHYAKALPVDHGWPPFLIVADIGHCLEIYADFTGTGKSYAQFPDRSRYRIMLDDLRDPDVRQRLHAIWTEPLSLDPAAQSARVTRDIADLLAVVAKRIERRGYHAERTSGFLMRILFTMFAEDCGLIPPDSFTQLLKSQRAHPEHLEHQLSALWRAMDKGEFSPALGVPLRQFNGYLFKDPSAIPLEAEELDVLIKAAEQDWTEVEPAIFGTLLERALNPKERAKLGAHYTPRAYVDRLIGPALMEPLRSDWDGVRAAAAKLIEEGKADEARTHVEAFHRTLSQTKVLDPACGTGNFLYVALARMKELEGEVIDLLVELGDAQYVAELAGHTIMPENFLGLEINPRAAAIARLVLWIGYLQWHFRVNGKDRAPPEPILRDVQTIEHRDALIAYDDRVPERDEQGRPLSRWDGEGMKVHPVTGRTVPDEAAQIALYRYVNPRAADWPKADFIIGNPPFIGGKDVRARLGDGYFEALFRTSNVPESADFVMHWWARAAQAVRQGRARRFGFVTTNSITQTFSRRVVAQHLEAKDGLSICFAIADHPWVDEKDGAAVRIAMTVAAKGRAEGRLVLVVDETQAPDLIMCAERIGTISSNLRIGADVTAAVPLKANGGLCSRGVPLHGRGFLIEECEVKHIGQMASKGWPDIVKPYANGKDLAGKPRGLWVIDTYGLTEEELRKIYPNAYQHLLLTVKPERDQNNRGNRSTRWWLHGEPSETMREGRRGLFRSIVTIETAKHRVFQFLPNTVLPDNRLVCFGLDDAFDLAVLSSRLHVSWTLTVGGTLEDRPIYTKTACFDPFPFPADVPESLKDKIRAEAEALDALRKQVLAAQADLTLTGLYNVLEALRAGRVLTAAERDVHDRGLVSLIRRHHDAIDTLVAEAYGWPADLSEDEVLVRLVALNRARAEEEAKGLVRWLRPAYQAPDYVAPVAQLDLGETPALVADNVIPWPEKLPEQVSAVIGVLARSPRPLAAQDVARNFRGKRSGSITPVLETLAGLGMARKLSDGRYAA